MQKIVQERKKKVAETFSVLDRMEPKKIDLDTPFWKRFVNGEKPIEFRSQAETERDSFGAFGTTIYNAKTSAPQPGQAVEAQKKQPGSATDPRFWKRSVNDKNPIEFRVQAETERDSFGAFGTRIYNAETAAPQSGEAVEAQRIQPGSSTDSDIPLTTLMLRHLSHQYP